MTITPMEASLAGLLHDIGKLIQRAHSGEVGLPDPVRRRESVLLPHDQHARYTHRHALWSDVFFDWTDHERLFWPSDIDHRRVRDAAVFHHKPDLPEHWLIAEADRMASGLDRKERDAADDSQPAGIKQFRRVSLQSTMAQIQIGLGKPPGASHVMPAVAPTPDALFPAAAAPDAQPARYTALWEEFQAIWKRIATIPQLGADRLEQALLAVSHRLLWAVPSSTQHQPDVSLHDHARTVAAIAACLALHHAARGDGDDTAAIRDRGRKKFRFIELDLSGIQRALLRLRSEQARGTARILRARSFLIGATLDAAVLRLRHRLGLPASCVLLAAGGRAQLLAADVPGLDERIQDFVSGLDRWMVERWQGDLALPIGLGAPFAGEDFAPGRLWRIEAEAAAALDAAKNRPLGSFGTGVLAHAPFQLHGQCQSCGARPAEIADRLETSIVRCRACDEAHQLGRALRRRAEGVALLSAREASRVDVTLPDGLALVTCLPERAALALMEGGLRGADAAFDRAAVPLPRPYVPFMPAELPPSATKRYEGLEEIEADGLKTFGHLAADALEEVALPGGGTRLAGRKLLAIVKADVDRLGIVFGHGLAAEGRTPARVAQLSRLMDGFFGLYLPDLLQRKFPDTYTVYAGGDDLLLVCPWRLGAPLALALREEFGRFSGQNPNLSLSAGVAYVAAEQPLNRAVEEAEHLLERAKRKRNQVGLLDRALDWPRLAETLTLADDLLVCLRNGSLPASVLHRAQDFARQRGRIETVDDKAEHVAERMTERERFAYKLARADDARWLPRWLYTRARFEDRNRHQDIAAVRAALDRLLPPPGQKPAADGELAASFALWRDR